MVSLHVVACFDMIMVETYKVCRQADFVICYMHAGFSTKMKLTIKRTSRKSL